MDWPQPSHPQNQEIPALFIGRELGVVVGDNEAAEDEEPRTAKGAIL
jgi:hypothetical protein